MIRPIDHQPRLPREHFLTTGEPDPDAVPLDVAIVGGGPAGLATAIELARLSNEAAEAGEPGGGLEIGVLEKAAALGEHNLSGAVIDRRVFSDLFPGMPTEEMPFRGSVDKESVYFLTKGRALRVPTPPTMRNHGNRLASICEVVRWMGERAEAMGVNIFPGFPVASLRTTGESVTGVRTSASGLDRSGKMGSGAMPPLDITARVTVLAEGARGPLTQTWLDWQGVTSPNPQIYALGVKELWEAPQPLDRVVHTMGWPLSRKAFGGSFMYPMGGNLVSLGLVVGLDAPETELDVHGLLQRMKLHPFFKTLLSGGELLEWGARTIPEGGHYSLPERRHGDGLLIVGDAAGYVEVASLKGVHYAIHSGMLAARQAFSALQKDDTSHKALAGYTTAVGASHIGRDLRKRRNMRLAFKRGFAVGSARATLMTLTGGALSGRRIRVQEDARQPKSFADAAQRPTPAPAAAQTTGRNGKLRYSKQDAVFYSGNRTRDDIPLHLITADDPENTEPEVARMLEALCPAGVYEYRDDSLVVNAPNCVDCRATDVLGPRWTPREGGSGPAYRRM